MRTPRKNPLEAPSFSWVELTGKDDKEDRILITRVGFLLFESNCASMGAPLLPEDGLRWDYLQIPPIHKEQASQVLSEMIGLLGDWKMLGDDLRAIEKAFVQWDEVYVRNLIA